MRWSDANREYVQLSPIKKFLLFVLVFVGVIVLVRLLGPDPAKRGVTSPPVPDGTPIAQQQTSDPVGERRAYILRLREKFLDDGVNIEVSSEDSARQQIHLEGVPIGPVWYHRFKKSSLLREMAELGFMRVTVGSYEFGRQIELPCGVEPPATCARP